MSHSQIDQLVEALGFKIVPSLTAHCFHLVDKTEQAVICYTKHMGYISFLNYQNLEDDLLTAITHFNVINKQAVVNPYLGCKTFEEALVQKDLCNV